MPLPTLLCLAFAAGLGAAVAAHSELRVSPRPSVLTRSFGAFMIFVGLVVLPISVYFYTFHGDWFLAYTVDVRRLPSAVALLGFLLEAAIAAAGFVLGAVLVRNRHAWIASAIAGVAVGGAVVVTAALRDRLAVVGTLAQYRGDFGLSPVTSGPLLAGTLAMTTILVAGYVWLVTRLRGKPRRA